MEVHDLPTLNATLNSIAAVLLFVGWRFIRNDKKLAHRNCMIAAFLCSVLFLVSYLVYHYHAGSVRFPGTGAVRIFYLSVLFSHIVLAALVPFLALVTLRRGLLGRFGPHVAIARYTLPIWLYVSVTGVIVYVMLYRMSWT